MSVYENVRRSEQKLKGTRARRCQSGVKLWFKNAPVLCWRCCSSRKPSLVCVHACA